MDQSIIIPFELVMVLRTRYTPRTTWKVVEAGCCLRLNDEYGEPGEGKGLGVDHWVDQSGTVSSKMRLDERASYTCAQT